MTKKDIKSCFSVKNLILTSKQPAKHLFADRNTQHIRLLPMYTAKTYLCTTVSNLNVNDTQPLPTNTQPLQTFTKRLHNHYKCIRKSYRQLHGGS